MFCYLFSSSTNFVIISIFDLCFFNGAISDPGNCGSSLPKLSESFIMGP